MRPYFIKTPKLFKWIYPKRVWAFSQKSNTIYLTFDDGPIPEVTPWVLDILKQYNAKATFFCIGDNIKKHPEIFRRILSEGHSIGNHTFNHLNGWKTPTHTYIENVQEFEEVLSSGFKIQDSKLFRPPYGKLHSAQARILLKKGYKIIMWDVLSADFDPGISKEKCFKNISKNISAGSIVVFHDSLKAKRNLEYTLPRIIKLIQERKWRCATI